MGRPPRITRPQLLSTAAAVFAAKGFEATTLADIAKELGVTAAAVLRHVESKQALFAEAMRPPEIQVPEFVAAVADVDPSTDPRIVLRTIAENFIPFVQNTIAANLAVYMHQSARSFVIPFDPDKADSPPRRGLKILTNYFRRAADAGVIRIEDPRAAALLFMGSLHSYVFFHQILNISPTPYPLDRYIDALLDLWSHGGFGGTRGKQSKTARQNRAGGAGPRAARGGRTLVSAPVEDAEGSRPRRVARSKDGERGVARRRPRRPRPDR